MQSAPGHAEPRTDARPVVRRTPIRVAALVALAVILLQAAWIATVPPFRGSDEVDHAFRAAGVADGQWRAGAPIEDGRGLQVRVPTSLVDAARHQCQALEYNGPDNCTPVRELSAGRSLIGSSAGAYPPTPYLLAALGSRVAEGTASLLAMRAFTALGCAAMIALGAWALATWSRTRWPVAALVVALTPVAVYSMSLPAPNGLEIAAAIATWCCLLGVGERPDPRLDRRLLLAAVPPLALLLSARTLGPLFALLIVLSVLAVRPTTLLGVARRQWRTVALGSLVLAATSVATLWWIASADLTTPEPGPAQALRPALHLPVWLLQTIAAFPTRGDATHPLVYALGLVTLLTLWLTAARRGGRPAVVGGVVLLVAAVALPITLTLATVETAGVIWQGRYTLPLLVGVSLLAGLVLDRQGTPPGPMASAGLVLLTGAASLISLLTLLTEERTSAPSATDPTWTPVPSVVVIALVLGAGLVWWRALREPTP